MVPQSISSENALSDEERRAFTFFRNRTAKRIFGQQDAGDWVPVLLHLGYNELSVKHAITALASLHESLDPNKPSMWALSSPQHASTTARLLALKHYTKAMQSVRIEAANMSSRPDLTLILCILFICFEQFRSGDAACFLHLKAGLKLVHWWRSNTNDYSKLINYSRPTLELMNDKITPILQRLRVQFSLCMDSRHTLGNAGTTPHLPAPIIPSSYGSLYLARRDFDRAMNFAFSSLESKPVRDCQQPYMSPIIILHQWKHALNSSTFATEPQPLQTCVHKLLELYYHVSTIIISTYGADEESVFDDYFERFQSIVDLAEEILETWQMASQHFSLLFSFDLGITPPMFLVASRCRNSKIRRKAVSLMFQSPFYHGVWRDQYSGLCAQRIVDLEEEGLVSLGKSVYVPEHRRIRKLSADIQEDNQRIAMRFVRWPYNSDAEVISTFIALTGTSS